MSFSDQLLQGPHEDHPVSADELCDLHRRGEEEQDLQIRPHREVRMPAGAQLQAQLRLRQGEYF